MRAPPLYLGSKSTQKSDFATKYFLIPYFFIKLDALRVKEKIYSLSDIFTGRKFHNLKKTAKFAKLIFAVDQNNRITRN